MAAPIVGALLRPLLGQAAKTALKDTAKSAAKTAAKDTAKSAAEETAAKKIAGLAINTTKSALKESKPVKSITKDINKASKVASKSGKEFASDIVSGAKEQAKSSLLGKISLPDTVTTRVAQATLKDGVAGGAKEVSSYLDSVISRQRKIIENSSSVLKITNNGESSELISNILNNASKGMSIPESVNRAIKETEGEITLGSKYTVGGKQTFKGKEAVEIARKIDNTNEARAQYRNLSVQPKTVQNYRMRELGLKPTGKINANGEEIWESETGREYTTGEVEGLSGGNAGMDRTEPEHVSPVAVAKNESQPAVARSVIRPVEQWAKNLGKSLRTSGVDSLAPVVYRDIMVAVAKMPPTRLAWVAGQSPTRRKTVMYQGKPKRLLKATWLSSDTIAIRSSLKDIMTAVGLDPKNYTWGQVNMMPEIDDIRGVVYDD